MWSRGFASPSPISSSFRFEARRIPSLVLQLLEPEVNPTRVVGRRALDLLQPLPEAIGRAADLSGSSQITTGRSSSEKTERSRGFSIGVTSSHPGNASPGGGRSRPGMSASRTSSASRSQKLPRPLELRQR